MPSSAWDTRQINTAADAVAPDGSAVRVLCAARGGSTALFTLPPGAVAQAVVHRTIDEVWYVVAGTGRIWRRCGGEEGIAALAPGVSLTISVGVPFQFRNDGAAPLEILGVSMPPWPGDGEAQRVAGRWVPAL